MHVALNFSKTLLLHIIFSTHITPKVKVNMSSDLQHLLWIVKALNLSVNVQCQHGFMLHINTKRYLVFGPFCNSPGLLKCTYLAQHYVKSQTYIYISVCYFVIHSVGWHICITRRWDVLNIAKLTTSF